MKTNRRLNSTPAVDNGGIPPSGGVLDKKIREADDRIQIAFQRTADCQRIAAVEGVGPLIATAIVAAISNGHAFENGRPEFRVRAEKSMAPLACGSQTHGRHAELAALS